MLQKIIANDPKTLEYLKGRKEPVIDTHTFWTESSSERAKINTLTPEKLNSSLKLMNVHGIGIPMDISQNKTAGEIIGSFDHIIASYLHFNPNPDYKVHLGYISPEDADELATQKHFVGFKTLPSLSRTSVDDPRNSPFYEVAIKHGLPVLIHCSSEGNKFSSVEKFRTLAERYPKLKIIMAHFGGLRVKYMKDTVNFAEDNTNIYLNTTSLNPFRSHPCISNTVYEKKERVLPDKHFFDEVLQIFLDASKKFPKRIIFGTDLGIFHVDAYSLWPIYELHDKKLESRILFANPLQLFKRLRFPKN